MRSLVRLAATSVAAASLLLGTLVAPAAAATSPINVTSVSIKASYGGPAISAKTKYYEFTTKASGSVSQGWVDIVGDVYRGSTKVASNIELGYVYSGGKDLTGYVLAKNSWGRGTFKVKNVRVVHDLYNNTVKTYKDTTVSGGTFYIKSAINGNLTKYGTVIQVKTSGSKKTVKVGIKQYTVKKAWEPYKGKKVKIQQKKGGKWVTKKTVKLNSKGKATYKLTSAKKYKYRVLVPGSSTVVGGYSQGTPKL
ncbi:hypothetical protein [Isoptericola dokdonensis]|jgi:hypothetical protein|uniref:Bacterial Ig domain-containing protein n=1 Tax=Isoptericola dokdonensis DS-3 TaxID=1300344 RepID=A0A161IFC9_9MICO|nr:hypothetical protein [Isoptericola dokdonensis]ANC32137.1 hypothetical protein I598_2605 [Isoptericola dokdonensis DS-3]